MLKCAAISDTHGTHYSLKLEGGDILIHAGDVSKMGLRSEIEDFLNWFEKQDYRYKIWIGGNHDFWLEDYAKGLADSEQDSNLIKRIHTNWKNDIYYLHNSEVEVEGYKFWGSPYTPEFYNWAFMYKRGEGHKHWDLIPADTDILIIHGPPACPLGLTETGFQAGCSELSNRISQIKPKYHIFGHIHEAKGVVHVAHDEDSKITTLVNASYLTSQYRPYPKEPVYYFELPHKNVTFEL